MTRYAVGHYSLHDNMLTVEIIEADDPLEAAHSHSKFTEDQFAHCTTLDEAKAYAFDCDEGLDVVEIK